MTTCAACVYEAAGPFRFCPECGVPAGEQGREQRRMVTVLFEQMKAIVERHGGVVEKFMAARTRTKLADAT